MFKLASILSLLLLASCNSFSDKVVGIQPIQENQSIINLIKGNYETKAFRVFDQNGPLPLHIGMRGFQNFIDIVEDRNRGRALLPDNENLVMRIDFIDEGRMGLSFLDEFNEVYYIEYSGQVKKDGFFYLDQKFKSYIGLPYIFGGLYKYKSRIGVDKHGSLLLQTAELNQGAFLFFLQKGYKRHRMFKFRRIHEELRV